MTGRGTYEVTAQPTNYTLLGSDSSGVFTNRGASGTVTYTLPDPSIGNKGMSAKFIVVADFPIVIRAVSANKMTVFNNQTATSISWATGGQQMGNGCECISDGTTWLVLLNPSTASGATTVSTITIA